MPATRRSLIVAGGYPRYAGESVFSLDGQGEKLPGIVDQNGFREPILCLGPFDMAERGGFEYRRAYFPRAKCSKNEHFCYGLARGETVFFGLEKSNFQ